MSYYSQSKNPKKDSSQVSSDTVTIDSPHEASPHPHPHPSVHSQQINPFSQATPISIRTSTNTLGGLGIHDAYIELANNLRNSLQTSPSTTINYIPQEDTHNQNCLSESATRLSTQGTLQSSNFYLQHQIHQNDANLESGLSFIYNTQYPGHWSTSWAPYIYDQIPEVSFQSASLSTCSYSVQPELPLPLAYAPSTDSGPLGDGDTQAVAQYKSLGSSSWSMEVSNPLNQTHRAIQRANSNVSSPISDPPSPFSYIPLQVPQSPIPVYSYSDDDARNLHMSLPSKSSSSTSVLSSQRSLENIRHECPYCRRQFRRKHDLQRHIRLHTGERPYRCEKCFKSFYRTDALVRHVRSEHH